MAELFGFRIERPKKAEGSVPSFTSPTADDGTIDIAGGGFFGQILDQDGRERTDIDLIRRYRDIAQQPECDMAIEDIVNEGIISNEADLAVQVTLDRLPFPETIKRRIRKEFEGVLRLLHFEFKGHDVFRRWYVDGRIFFHKIIDTKNPKQGIIELRYIDPTKIKKARQVKKAKDNKTGVDMVQKIDEYFIYNEISRAPERRIFYIDVGNLPKVKAEQYLKDVMNRYRNKLVYDAQTGEIRDDRNHMSMLEDFWLPRREGGRGTEITTLPGGSNLGEIDDIIYFQKKLYKSLNVPITRMDSESGFSLGRTTEITRDELKFTKFVQRIRKKFTPLFTDILKTQLLLKGIIAPDDWPIMQEHIQYDFLQDGHFAELKDAELLENRINTLESIQSYVGTFFSKEYVLKNVLRMNDAEIDEMRKQIQRETEIDPMDGGIDVPDGGDGITRYPQDGGGGIIPPEAMPDYEEPSNGEGEK